MPDKRKESQRKPADHLIKENAGVELTEGDLNKVSGGTPNLMNACATGQHVKIATT